MEKLTNQKCIWFTLWNKNSYMHRCYHWKLRHHRALFSLRCFRWPQTLPVAIRIANIVFGTSFAASSVKPQPKNKHGSTFCSSWPTVLSPAVLVGFLLDWPLQTASIDAHAKTKTPSANMPCRNALTQLLWTHRARMFPAIFHKEPVIKKSNWAQRSKIKIN